MAIARYLADKSALARMHLAIVRDALGPLIERGLVGTCGMVETELLYSARNVAEHDTTRHWLAALEWLPTPDETWEWVAGIQRELTERGRHRAVPIPDLVIAATAQRQEVTVLHYDADFDLLREITGQPMAWIAPRGSC